MSLNGVMNVVSTFFLLVAIMRLILVLRSPSPELRFEDMTNANGRSDSAMRPNTAPLKDRTSPRRTPTSPGHRDSKNSFQRVDVDGSVEHAITAQQRLGLRRGAADGADKQADSLGSSLGILQNGGRSFADRYEADKHDRHSRSSSASSISNGATKREGGDVWGVGKRVLIFTMDSLDKTVKAAARGGPAGEIKIRESLSQALVEAGVQVTLVFRALFLILVDIMCMYDKYTAVLFRTSSVCIPSFSQPCVLWP